MRGGGGVPYLYILLPQVLRGPGNQEQEALSKHVIQQMKTVERFKEEAVARGTHFDDDVAGLIGVYVTYVM